MAMFDPSTSIIYRYRYWIGYGSIAVLLAGLLLLAGFVTPGAFTEAEHRAIVQSSTILDSNLLTSVEVNTPYALLLHASLSIFGVTLLGVKLPSLILGFITAVLMVLLLRRWTSPGVAILASVIAISTSQFLFVAQQGAPSILYLFWPIVLLYLGTLVAKRAKGVLLWKQLFFVSVALSLYTPLSIYVLIALGSAALLHPHLRHVLRRLSRPRLLVGIVIAAAITAPIIASSIADPSLGLRLLGIPIAFPDIIVNLKSLAEQYVGFTSIGTGSALLPIFGLGSTLIIGFGLYRLIRHREAASSYVVLAWTICLLPIIVMQPGYISIMFVPLLLMLATGLEGVLRVWYGLFPKNPYARVAGLVPMGVLVGAMVLFGLERYTYAYRYAPDTVKNFSVDLLILPEATSQLVTTNAEQPLYQAVASYRTADHPLTVTIIPLSSGYTVTAEAYGGQVADGVITNSRAADAARFYVYK